jgi:hypothetical protein
MAAYIIETMRDTMNAHKCMALLMALAMLLAAFSTSTAQSVSSEIKGSAAEFPWVEQLFDSQNFSALSNGFGGVNQVPMISYILSDGQHHRVAKKFAVGMNLCGPGDTWSCLDFPLSNLGGYVSGTMSEMALVTMPNLTEYRAGWALLNNSDQLKYYYRTYGPLGNETGMATETIMTLGSSLSMLGRPSLAYDSSGKPHVAVLIRYSDITFPADYLYYIYDSGVTNSSCGASSTYQCDIIASASGLWEYVGSPVIGLTSSDQPRIVYVASSSMFGTTLLYAYPQANPVYSPNCGPDDNTWRCITINDGDYTITGLDMDVRSTNPQVTYTIAVTDLYTQTLLQYAKRVGSLGGDCGTDTVWFVAGVTERFTWDCSPITVISNDGANQDVAIQVDAQNQPVIAYRDSTGSFWDLRLFRGDPEAVYTDILLDNGGPDGSNQGRAVDLALNGSDLGFVDYSEDLDTETNLKIIYQVAKIYLPTILR